MPVPQLLDGDGVGDGEAVLPAEALAEAAAEPGCVEAGAGEDDGSGVCDAGALAAVLSEVPLAGEPPVAAAVLPWAAPDVAAPAAPAPESGTETAPTRGGAGAASAAGGCGVNPACERLGTDDGETLPRIEAGADTAADGESPRGLENFAGLEPSWTVGAGAAVGAGPSGNTPRAATAPADRTRAPRVLQRNAMGTTPVPPARRERKRQREATTRTSPQASMTTTGTVARANTTAATATAPASQRGGRLRGLARRRGRLSQTGVSAASFRGRVGNDTVAMLPEWAASGQSKKLGPACPLLTEHGVDDCVV